MSQTYTPPIHVHVDPANPGQFFACCGLLELGHRLWKGAEGWFDHGGFCLRPYDSDAVVGASLEGLVSAIANAQLRQMDLSDDYSSPVEMAHPFDFRLDWWTDTRSGGGRLKVWAGSMRSFRIARAMQAVLQRAEVQSDRLLDYRTVVYDTLKPDNKVEPFYFDARRGMNAQSIDVGFSPDSLQVKTVAYPGTEFLCFVGLQRCRPLPAAKAHVFEYCTWTHPLTAEVAPLAVCGVLPQVINRKFRFENAFRTDQRKHKAFTSATPIS